MVVVGLQGSPKVGWRYAFPASPLVWPLNYVCMHVCLCVCVSACMYACLSVCMFMYTYIYIYIYMCVCVCLPYVACSHTDNVRYHVARYLLHVMLCYLVYINIRIYIYI